MDNSAYYDSREYNILAGGKNLAKWTGIFRGTPGNWSYSLHYHLLDHLGSRQVVTDSNGTAIASGDIDYSEFGEHAGGSSDEYSYTGKKADFSAGLVYFNARYYFPEIGRFVSMDPVKSGVNWYVYCENNPLKYRDLNGLESVYAFSQNYLPNMISHDWATRTFFSEDKGLLSDFESTFDNGTSAGIHENDNPPSSLDDQNLNNIVVTEFVQVDGEWIQIVVDVFIFNKQTKKWEKITPEENIKKSNDDKGSPEDDAPPGSGGPPEIEGPPGSEGDDDDATT